MAKSKDAVILSRKTLCQIVYFLCTLLKGETVSYDAIYESSDEDTFHQH